MIYRKFNEFYYDYLKKVHHEGRLMKARGQGTLDIGPQLIKFNFNNLGDSLCTFPTRKMNYGFGLIEKLAYLYGADCCHLLSRYVPRFADFCETYHSPSLVKKELLKKHKGNYIYDPGAYGPRTKLMWKKTVELLQKDQYTRQAIFTVWRDTDTELRNKPCTMYLSFRGDVIPTRLNANSIMRSNDLLWGTPYDLSAFAFIHHVMGKWTGRKPYELTHYTSSLHLYESQVESKLLGFVDEYELPAKYNERGFKKIPKLEGHPDFHFEETFDLSPLDNMTLSMELAKFFTGIEERKPKKTGSKYLDLCVDYLNKHYKEETY
tara:strand:- start:9187 stop:10146 length:960 start_codon:yes stop_codon:yes gene_type:complete